MGSGVSIMSSKGFLAYVSIMRSKRLLKSVFWGQYYE
jgi:hypothetical protein